MARVRWDVKLDTAARAADVRRQFVHFLRSSTRNGDGRFFDAELVVGELLANVARHEPGEARITVDVAGDEAIVTLDGPGPTQEDPAALPDGFSESGRGLYLVQALARDYYCRPTSEGMSTTVVLALRAHRPV